MRCIENSGYQLDKEGGFWSNPEMSPFTYSDGQEVEQHILRIVTEASDLSSWSDELQSSCKDWVTWYHLSKQRANLLRPFEEFLTGSVLEIGAGCGAVTRYLAEVAESVLALEGSHHRAQIAVQRTRDLGNVTIVVDNIGSFALNQKFDVVVVVGVLEYADVFLEGEDPFDEFLQLARNFLSEDGFLLLAIENKFGLKYFAGANEDHLGTPMAGLEGRYRVGGPRTFSKRELRQKLMGAGFAGQFFHSPIPDYKLPIGVITQQGILDPRFNSAALSGEASFVDPQLPLNPSFNPLLAWTEIGGENFEIDLSNSFLVEAHPRRIDQSITSGLLAEHYGSVRKTAFQKTKRFSRRGTQVVVNSFSTLGGESSSFLGDVSQSFPPESYLVGESVRTEFVKQLVDSQDPDEVLASWVLEWLDILETFANSKRLKWPQQISPGAGVDGRLIDALPRNAIRTTDGVKFFDQEWSQSGELSIERLLYRVALDLYFAMPAEWQARYSPSEILGIFSKASKIDCSITESGLNSDSQFQELVTHPSLERNIVQQPRLGFEVSPKSSKGISLLFRNRRR